jgi:hypothetical protein
MLRRTPIKPGKGFKRKAPPPRPCKQVDYEPRPRAAAVAVADTRARMVVQVPKDEPVRHEGYRRLVASLPCIRCKQVGRSQAAHPNTGKGAMLKTDDRLCFPLCADGPGVVGCHTMFDQGALFTKEWRRKHETVWGLATRTAVKLAGAWPADLEPWPEDEEATA